MVAIHLDANYIFAEPMKSRTEGEMISVYQKDFQKDESSRVGTKKAGAQQHMLSGDDGMHQGDNIPTNNGAVLNILQIIRAVMSSAAEAELGALFINAKNRCLHAPHA
jgi:hypothetical protein